MALSYSAMGANDWTNPLVAKQPEILDYLREQRCPGFVELAGSNAECEYCSDDDYDEKAH
jgi:hypothetical protein